MSGEVNSILLRLWESPPSVSVEIHSIEWKELTNFNDSFLKVVHEANEISLLTDSIRTCWRIRRVLLSNPLSPTYFAEAFQGIITDCHHFVDVASEHAVVGRVTALKDSCVALAGSANPLARELENLASQFDRTGLLLSEENLRVPVEKLLDEIELDGISVLSLKQLRNFDATELDSLIYVGNPQQTFRRSIATSKADAQRSGWLITSPPATKLFILETNLARPVIVDNLWLLEGSRPAIEINEMPKLRRPKYKTELLEVGTQAKPQISWNPRNTEHRVLCLQIGFQSGRFAFFSHSKLGAPRVIDTDESGRVDVARLPALNLVPGMVILLQGSRSDTEELRERAIQLLRLLGTNQSEIDEVLDLVSRVKSKLAEALDTRGAEWLEARLSESGLDTRYAKYLTSAPLHPDYIAPTKGFGQFLAALGLDDEIGKRSQIEKYRGACRRAGQRMDRGLLRDLETDTEWEDRLDADGTASIARRDSGTLLIERITYIGDSVEVPMSQIGKMIGARR